MTFGTSDVVNGRATVPMRVDVNTVYLAHGREVYGPFWQPLYVVFHFNLEFSSQTSHMPLEAFVYIGSRLITYSTDVSGSRDK